ncbi:MAG: energy transducer TonB [Candidatus Cloacimonadaceae bacterium]|jgi:protein TonB|nr:energy transducer TonB [Candidatus Cloacimonadota bacterium]MDD5624779.1 energy transducer TonB [Candidatus Cloacimonadota bacterium]MDY0111989.1 energy transducer TonB [Candidatus Syntrophosphaera sp.]
MENNKILDWKDYCDAQFGKAVALALAIMLLIYLIAPKTETRVKKELVTQVEIAEAPPDTRQKEETQTETEIDISVPVISEELATEDTPELAEKRALALQQFGNLQSTTSTTLQQSDERPFDFVPWDDPPVPIGSIKPAYPEFARKAGIQGTVVLEVDVYKDGTVGNIRVIRSVQPGPGGLDEAAIEAVRKIRFQPGKSSGNPVDTTVIIPIEFKLN